MADVEAHPGESLKVFRSTEQQTRIGADTEVIGMRVVRTSVRSQRYAEECRALRPRDRQA